MQEVMRAEGISGNVQVQNVPGAGGTVGLTQFVASTSGDSSQLIVGGLPLQLIRLKPLGFSIVSSILFACTAAAFGKRNLALSLPIGIIFTLVVYRIFDRLLQLNLPAGLPETLLFGGKRVAMIKIRDSQLV